ncbi:MAG: adenine phosphoribosyltransferase [Opitutales bacterium]
MSPERVKSAIRTIPGFPKPGINFRDVPALFEQPDLFAYVIDEAADWFAQHACEVLVGIDARGFVLAGALAARVKKPLFLVRKKGKIPTDTVQADYQLEYGSATLELSRTAHFEGTNVLIVDDLLATGGTAEATCRLLRELGAAQLAFGTVVRLSDLQGKERLEASGVPVHAICAFTEAE